MQTRRELNKLILTAAASLATSWLSLAEPTFSSKFNGAHIGVQTYSYRSLRDASAPWSLSSVERLMDRVASAIAEGQIDLCEFRVALAEPPQCKGETICGNGASRPLDIFERARKRFNGASIEIYASMSNFDDKCTDDEIQWAFDVAKALGTGIITANCTVALIKRVAPFADKHKMIVSAHSEDAPFDPNIDGMVFANNLLDAAKLAPYMRITLDIGHFTAYGGDAVKFVRENHAKIANLHLKDRLKNHPEPHTDKNTPEWGKGDVPIKQVLQLMKSEKYPFPACIEYEYKSDKPAVAEVRRCLEYARAALA